MFLIAAPESGGAEHMKLLSSLARALVRKDFVESLRNATTPDEVVALVDGVVNPAPAAAARCEARRRRCEPAEAPAPSSRRRSSRSPPARPASPTPTWPPTRWSPPPRTPASPCTWRRRARRAARRCRADTIAAADAVIFATDVGVKDRQRFAGKPVVASGVKRAINEPDKMVAEALAAADNPNAARVEG